MAFNIGFVSTRFSGTDGVSLEASKWADVFEKNGNKCFWFAGELNRPEDRSFLVPEAHFTDKQNKWINDQVFGKKGRTPEVTELIHNLRTHLKKHLHHFIEKHKIDVLIAENALTIPMHIPLGLALAETIAETQIFTIAHHHDFYWERVRFSINAVGEYLHMAFPPKLSNIKHVVINSEAQEQLAHRTGISSVVVPNVLDFGNPPTINREKALEFRKSIGLSPDDIIIVQPTRIIQRKGIEHAIELVNELRNTNYKLIITHEAGDEGYEYAEWLMEYALDHDVDLRLVNTHISDPWAVKDTSEEKYSLWDVYSFADFITYPSLYEGFGNAFLEAIYFKKPLMVNRYQIFVRDIEPLGFKLAVMDGYLSKRTVQEVKDILNQPELRQKVVDHNYALASHHFSFQVLKNHLDLIMREFHLQGDIEAFHDMNGSLKSAYMDMGQDLASKNISKQIQ